MMGNRFVNFIILGILLLLIEQGPIGDIMERIISSKNLLLFLFIG